MKRYEEIQKFREPWIWIGLITMGLITSGIFGAGIYIQIIRGQKFGNNPMSDQGLIVTFLMVSLLFMGLFLLFGLSKLTTRIDEVGVQYRFFPFHLKYRRVEWKDVEDYEVVTYNPVRDYGGWGIKSGKKGKAYNVSGNLGLMLKLKSGKSVLIGTGNHEEIKTFLERLNNYKTIYYNKR